jgi:HSP20 family protein
MPLLVRSDPYRDVDRFMELLLNDSSRRAPLMTMPMDAYRKEDTFLLQFDLPGIKADSIELTIDNNTLVVKAERKAPVLSEGTEALVAERPHGTFSRQVLLGDGLDTSRVDAQYNDGVLVLSIPVAEEAKPRRIEVRQEPSKVEISA